MGVSRNIAQREATAFAICICTYKRPQLLRLLMEDVCRQTLLPEFLIIVDGDPQSGAVQALLSSRDSVRPSPVIYIPSNHGNLSYQRYLGWKAAKSLHGDLILYLDDDLRIRQKDAVEKTIKPLSGENNSVVGVTAIINFGEFINVPDSQLLAERQNQHGSGISLVRWFGAARKVAPGGLSPAGNRKTPVNSGKHYEPAEWLRGGVMAYHLWALTEDCFSADLFALDHIRCGLGEDTFLSRRVGAKGTLLMALCASFEHPHNDLPKSYPIEAFRFGVATAYSRRFLNDHYRGFDPPLFSDRLALIKSYAGTSLLNWWRAVRRPRRHRVAYAWGYTVGAFQGLVQKPTARRLTPHINWWQDAETALHEMVIIREGKGE